MGISLWGIFVSDLDRKGLAGLHLNGRHIRTSVWVLCVDGEMGSLRTQFYVIAIKSTRRPIRDGLGVHRKEGNIPRSFFGCRLNTRDVGSDRPSDKQQGRSAMKYESFSFH